MKPNLHWILVIEFVAFCVSCLAQDLPRSPNEMRTWTDRSGRTLEAEYLSFSGGKVRIRRASDGKIFRSRIDTFSDTDQEFVRSNPRLPLNTKFRSGKLKIQVGDPNLKFDTSKFDSAYPQMRIWQEAGMPTGIPYLGDQLKRVVKVFKASATNEEIKAYFESPRIKNKQVIAVLRNGVYDFDESVRIYSHATLIGESRDGVIIHMSGNAGIHLSSGTGNGLRNLTLVGKWKETPPESEVFAETLPGKGKHRMINMSGCVGSFVDNVKILNSASHPIWVGGKNNTIRNLEIDGAYCKGPGCQGYFFIGGERNLITGCKVTAIRHISFQNQTSKENVFYKNDIRQEVSFHNDDGGDNLIENNRITIPRARYQYNAIMGPWSRKHKVGGLNFIYNNKCKEESKGKEPWSDSQLYTGPIFVSNHQNKERYKNFEPAKTSEPKGKTLYPVILKR